MKVGSSTRTIVSLFNPLAGWALFFIATICFTSPALAAVVVAKAFSPSTILAGGTSTLTFTLSTPVGADFAETDVHFDDALPTGMVVAATPNAANGCSGTLTAGAGASTISLSGGTVSQFASCTIKVDVTSDTPGLLVNSVTVYSALLQTSNTATATLLVIGPPTLSKSFGASTILVNASTSLSFTLQNTNTSTNLTGIAFTDTMPSGLVISTPNGLSGSCGGGTITATAGSNSISLSGAALASSSSCTFSVNVKGTSIGIKNNVTGNISSANGGTGGTAAASLTVMAPTPANVPTLQDWAYALLTLLVLLSGVFLIRGTKPSHK